jgi:hypothetical protein
VSYLPTGNGVHSSVTIVLSFWDRVRVLFGARLAVDTYSDLEKEPGRVVHSESHVTVGRPKPGSLVAESTAREMPVSTKRQPIPEATLLEENVDRTHIPTEIYSVCSRDAPAGSSVPCTQVHIILPIGDIGKLVLRLKSARALDELVGVLLEYRKDVWGEETPS